MCSDLLRLKLDNATGLTMSPNQHIWYLGMWRFRQGYLQWNSQFALIIWINLRPRSPCARPTNTVSHFACRSWKEKWSHYWLQVLKNGVEVKLQRNALSVLEAPKGDEEDDKDCIDCDNSLCSSSNVGEKEIDYRKKLFVYLSTYCSYVNPYLLI